jgi:calcineurin-like phosphoesterase family protein
MLNNTFLSSDWHLGHAKSIEYANRPFKDVSSMSEGLIRNHNSVVGKKDMSYFLGDMGRLPSNEFKRIINELYGVKILVLGNHDKNASFYLRHGFDVVLQSATIMVHGKMVTLSHYPLVGVKREDTSMYKGREHECWYKEDEFRHLAISYAFSKYHLHGHLHAPNNGRSSVKLSTHINHQWDIGVDGNNYTPVSIKQVDKWIRKLI